MQRTTIAALAIALAGLTGCITVSTPGQGTARTDTEYCAMLSDMYSRYLAGNELGQRRGSAGGDLDGRIAAAQCRQGNTAGISVLERKLVANGFTLPGRS